MIMEQYALQVRCSAGRLRTQCLPPPPCSPWLCPDDVEDDKEDETDGRSGGETRRRAGLISTPRDPRTL